MFSPNPNQATLFDPIGLGPLMLRNRIVMAPMTRNRAGDQNAAQPIMAEYYRQRASAGLIITEASQVSRQGTGYLNTPGCYSDAQVEGWRKVTDAVHSEGGRIFLQLWHVGRISHPSFQDESAAPVAPSAVLPKGEVLTAGGLLPYVTPRALEIDEIPGIIAQFKHGAAQAQAAGFDGVELHAANGYLIDQFIRDGTNKRTDIYGGLPENRGRLLREIIESVAGLWGSERVGVRLSPASSFNDMSDSDPHSTFGYLAEMLSECGLAYLHVVEESSASSFDWGPIRRAYRGIYMANGGYDRSSATSALAQGNADLISFGKPFISNPDLVGRLRNGVSLSPGDRSSFYGGDERGYTDYPALEFLN
jgi:N-ethylmaleimide reductase